MVLKTDYQGLAVVLLQCRLRALGLYKMLITGVFDDDTDEAVRAYQKQQGALVDGIVGKQTEKLLKKDTGEKYLCLFVHCAATREGDDLGPDWVVKLHMKKKGWSRTGYSDLVTLDGKLHNLRKWDSDNNISDWEYSFGVKGSTLLNRNSRHICYIGGVEKDGKTPKDTRTAEQKSTLETYVKFTLLQNPDLIILGHNQCQRKACPSFNVPDWLRSIGVGEHNIGFFNLYKQLY